MACFHPLHGYRSRVVTSSGKRAVVFSPAEGFSDLPVAIPCGQCVGCRLEKSRQWAMRCVHEASLHDENCFITLTYDDAHLPISGSLRKRDVQLFLKRLRKRYDERRIRYFGAGEYGGHFGRPHYHMLLFGFDFPDKEFWCKRDDYEVFRSASLEDTWQNGITEIGSVTFESASYCAGYLVTKRKGVTRVNVEGEVLEEEFGVMSRRPGIGKGWFDQFKDEVYQHDSVIMRGREMKPAKYYDRLMETEDGELVKVVRRRRRRARNVEEETEERLAVREAVTLARVNLGREVRA